MIHLGKVRQTIEETVKYMWRNQKNRLFMSIMLMLMVVYVIIFAPHFHSEYDMDMAQLETEMIGNGVQADNAKKNGLIVPSIMTQTTAYINQEYEFGTQRELLTTLRHGDIYRYLDLQMMEEPKEAETDISTMFYNLFGDDLMFLKSWAFRESVPDLNFHILHEITSLQQLHLFLIGAGPLILLSGLIFMISDVHTKDLTLKSQKSGVPLNWRSYLLVQSMTALGFVLAFYTIFFGAFYILNGVLHGFGGLHYPISFPQETVGWFLIRTVPYILILFILFSRLNTLISLWTRQSIVSMASLVFIVFFSSIYLDGAAADILPFNLGFLPISYIDLGQVIAGRHALVPAIRGLTVYTSGLVVLGLTILVVEIILYITSKRITRQKFTAKGAK